MMATSRGQAPTEPKKPGGDLLWLWLLLGALALVILAYVVDGAFRDEEFDADRFQTARPGEVVMTVGVSMQHRVVGALADPPPLSPHFCKELPAGRGVA